MGLFDSILSKIKEDLDQRTASKQVLSDVIYEAVHIRIPVDALELKDGVLKVSVTPTIKTALFLKKDAILTHLTNRSIRVSRII